MSDTKDNEGKIITNASEGYGYHYSSLADLSRAGVKISKMRVKPTEYGEFIEYLDSNGEWQTGAKIVPFEAKGMNPAQAYGAALTYARRYTVQMAECVACDDDDNVETKPKKSATNSVGATKASEKQVGYLKVLYRQGGMSDEDIERYTRGVSGMSSKQISQLIEKAKARLEEKQASGDVVPTEDEV